MCTAVLFASCKKDKLEVAPLDVPPVQAHTGYTGCQLRTIVLDVDSAWNDLQQTTRVIDLCHCDTLKLELTNIPVGHTFYDWAIFNQNQGPWIWASAQSIDTLTTDAYCSAFIDDGFAGWNIDVIADFDNCN